MPSSPDEQAGESTAWYASFWDFCAAYLEERFGPQWCLSPEQSVFLHTGNFTVPPQLLVRTPSAGNKPTNLLHNTSLLDVKGELPKRAFRAQINGLRVYSLPAALVAMAPGMFRENTAEVRTALAMIPDASDVLSLLLEGGHTTIAGRLAGAFRNIGRARIADEILGTMKSVGYAVRESDPFDQRSPFDIAERQRSPYVTRMRLMWQTMRQCIVGNFPEPPKAQVDVDTYMHDVEEGYITDAYHSLSIEGYRVSAELIERVRQQAWDPDGDDDDREHLDAMAARGYYDAFQAVKTSVKKVLGGENPGHVADDDHAEWYRKLFAPSVTAGIVRPADLAGYRNGTVFIRNSKHVPPSAEAVRDMMPCLFELLREEQDATVRVVLGHFVFVYIHPYIDGNGRMGRFLMNVMLAGGGYPWTVIPVDKRSDYMEALEAASVSGNIRPLTDFLATLVSARLAGEATPDLK